MVGGSAIAPAAAQATPTLSADPTSIDVGETTVITATECVAEGVLQNLLVVLLTVSGPSGTSTLPIPTDEFGTASFLSGVAEETDIGTYTITAQCATSDGESPIVLFDYAQTVILRVGVPDTTTTTAPTTTITAAPAVAATVTPAFTG